MFGDDFTDRENRCTFTFYLYDLQLSLYEKDFDDFGVDVCRGGDA